MKSLWKVNSQNHKEIVRYNSVVETILNYSLERKKVVSVETNDSNEYNVVGIVKRITAHYCIIKLVDEYGYWLDSDEKVYFQNISNLQCESADEIMIEKLINYNYQ